MGYCVPFALFSLGHPWPVLLPLGFLILFTNSAVPWAITNFIGLPWPNYFILILGVHGLAINPLLSLYALLLGLQWPIITFSKSYTVYGYAISLFPGLFKPIYLLKAHLFISWTCDLSFLPLGPDGFVICLLPLLLGFLPSTWILKKWPSTIYYQLWLALYFNLRIYIKVWLFTYLYMTYFMNIISLLNNIYSIKYYNLF